MSHLSETSPEMVHRCPSCDSVVAPEATRCLMCGAALSSSLSQSAPVQSAPASSSPPQPLEVVEKIPAELSQPEVVEPIQPTTPNQPDPISPVFTSVMRERQSPAVLILTAVFTLIIIIIGSLVWQYQDRNLVIALVPTATPLPPTPTYTSTPTPRPTATLPPTATPTITSTPGPTDTPQPPRLHNVAGGDTLIGLAINYRVSIESIAAENGFSVDTPIQLGQQLIIPWPTATPPLVSIGKEVNGELVIANPADCQRYTVQSGDSLSGIAGRFGVDYELFRDVNRLTDQTILQPGDTVCVPEIIFGGSLPPTPGPSPTPTLTPPPAGPQLLYPTNHTDLEPPDGVLRLQWTAVKNLADNEWYMVELTDLNVLDGLPYRGFTRDTSFQLPSSWRPPMAETHQFRWRVSIVQVQAFRDDGLPIYTYGGRSSSDSFFNWLGAIPTPTPSPTPTPTIPPSDQ